jgi:hypothetical protein
MKKALAVLVVLSFIGLGFGSAHALNTYYDNSQVYNNQIPYSAFFNGHSPKPEKIKVQVSSDRGVVQAIVPVNEKEQEVEQKGLED